MRPLHLATLTALLVGCSTATDDATVTPVTTAPVVDETDLTNVPLDTTPTTPDADAARWCEWTNPTASHWDTTGIRTDTADFTDYLTDRYDELVTNAPADVADVATVIHDAGDLYIAAVIAVDYDLLEADLRPVTDRLNQPAGTDAIAALNDYTLTNCGTPFGLQPPTNTDAATLAEQVRADYIAAGLDPDIADCLIDNLDATADYSDPDTNAAALAACGFDPTAIDPES